MTWDALRKSINGLVNKVNASNIKHILPEVFAEVGAAPPAGARHARLAPSVVAVFRCPLSPLPFF